MAGEPVKENFVILSKLGACRKKSAIKPPQSHMLNVNLNKK